MSNIFIHNDALIACDKMHSDIMFDLVYLDPPYATGIKFKTRDGLDAYSDAFTPDTLCDMLSPRITAIRKRMNHNASMYIHLDYRAVHEVKALCDRIFGRKSFQGEIIWIPGNGTHGAGLPSTHQTILVYANGELQWHKDAPCLREPFADMSMSMHFKKRDKDGRQYRDKIVRGKTYRYYADAGKAIGSVWSDIPAMSANSPILGETTGYPTQKPERLLERIIMASSNEGDVVADLMCGSGTALVAAVRLGRSFVGADSSVLASKITTSRLTDANIEFLTLH